ncbi:MAG: DEAD/DEAH box helicase [Oxalobacter sp.]|nr:DEAD/DEAH box helicase [Oxalobacter sp.]
MTFETLGLHPSILKALSDIHYDAPTTVQTHAIPSAMQGKDLLVSSQTGSGKTAAFMLPALHRFASSGTEKNRKTARQTPRGAKNGTVRQLAASPKMLVLTPTRELAQQIVSSTEQYCAYLKHIRTVAILGGMPYYRQMQLLGRQPDILVATPGRLIDYMQSGKIVLEHLEILVLDEADRMLDMGFVEDIEAIIDATPETRQTLLFSATLDGIVGDMAQRITHDAEQVHIASSSTRHEHIDQMLHFVDNTDHKNRLLDHWLKDRSLKQALVFTATKREADQVADRLAIAGFPAAALHGDMPQRMRNRTLERLRTGKIRILVATDVAARGIDIPTITHVFNYDLPKFAEDYVHRIGRTGRAGRRGLAISLVCPEDRIHIRRIERFIKQAIPVNVIAGFEPAILPKPSPSRRKPGWKPADRKHAAKAGQRHFGQPAASIHRKTQRTHSGRKHANDRATQHV